MSPQSTGGEDVAAGVRVRLAVASAEPQLPGVESKLPSAPPPASTSRDRVASTRNTWGYLHTAGNLRTVLSCVGADRMTDLRLAAASSICSCCGHRHRNLLARQSQRWTRRCRAPDTRTGAQQPVCGDMAQSFSSLAKNRGARSRGCSNPTKSAPRTGSISSSG